MAGQPITLIVPAVGAAGTTYASQINTAIGALEVELERKVVPADMDINADLSFLSGVVNSSATGVKRLGLTLQSETILSAAAFPMSLFTAGGDGELYFNDNAGRQVQVTNNGTINVASVGGITGTGYGVSSVELKWVGGSTEYQLRKGPGTNDYAFLRCDDIYLSDGSSNFIKLAAPAIATDYTLTLPPALPFSTSLVTLGPTGDLNSTSTPSVNGLTTGTLAVTTTSAFTGQATFSVESAHPTRSQHFAAPLGFTSTASGSIQLDGHWKSTAAGGAWCIPLGLVQGQRVSSVDFHIKTDAAAGTRVLDLGFYNSGTLFSLTFPGGSYAMNYSSAGVEASVNLNVTDFTVGVVNGTGVTSGLIVARFSASVLNDIFWGVTVNYSRI